MDPIELFETIRERKSIRKFQPEALERGAIEAILQAGTLAPSAKNRQPWQFVVAEGAAKADACAAMRAGLHREKDSPRLPGSRPFVAGAAYSLRIMKKCPAVVFVVDPTTPAKVAPQPDEEHFFEMASLQSTGACLQNMSLAATALGLGSLWVCDIYFAYDELCAWLGTGGRLVAALCLGVPDEAPLPRPRRPVADITEWRR